MKSYKLAFLTEQPFEGSIKDSCTDLRTDFAWMKALNAYHFPYDVVKSNPAFLLDFDLILVVVPKVIEKAHESIDTYLELTKLKRFKIGYVQEGPCWYHQRWPIPLQEKLFDLLESVDMIFCHNISDINYYKMLTYKPIFQMITPIEIKTWEHLRKVKKEEKIMISGTMREWYNGMSGIKVAEHFLDLPIYYPNMGTRRDDEFLYKNPNVHVLEYRSFSEWMKQLSTFKYALHLMPTFAAGSFALNCACLGIPCIGSQQIDTQRICYPYLSMEPYNLERAHNQLKRLINDKDYYNEQSEIAIKNCEKFTLEKFREKFMKDIEEVI